MSAGLVALWAALAACPVSGRLELEPKVADAACALEEASAAPAAVDRARLADVLSRERYQGARSRSRGALKELWDRFVAWLESFLGSEGAQSYSQATRFVVLVLAALAAAWGALRLAGTRLRRRARPADAPSDAARLELHSPERHLEAARAALGTSPREAIRQGLLALLSALEARHLARPDRVKTNRELVRELEARGATPPQRAAVEPLVRWYDGAFYSQDAVAADDARRFVQDVEAVTRLLGAAP